MVLPVRTLASLVLAATLVAGCSDDGCRGQSYHPDLGEQGSTSPIAALEVWLGSHEGFDAQPPDEGWIVEDSGDEQAARVVLTNDDGDGWWVAAVRADDGGYVVSEATDGADGCAGELS